MCCAGSCRRQSDTFGCLEWPNSLIVSKNKKALLLNRRRAFLASSSLLRIQAQEIKLFWRNRAVVSAFYLRRGAFLGFHLSLIVHPRGILPHNRRELIDVISPVSITFSNGCGNPVQSSADTPTLVSSTSPHLNGKVERSDLTDKKEFWPRMDLSEDPAAKLIELDEELGLRQPV